jgi:hypothetical protein
MKMENKNTGGPAFPVTETDRSGLIAPTESGITKLDYFAAKAMQAIIITTADNMKFGYDECANESYKYAEKMLKESKKYE